MIKEVQSGRVSNAIMLVNNCTDTDWFHKAADACDAVCLTRGRIEFLYNERHHEHHAGYRPIIHPAAWGGERPTGEVKGMTERTTKTTEPGYEARRARQRAPEYRAKRNARDRAKRAPGIALRKATINRLMEAQRAYEEARENKYRERAALYNVEPNAVRVAAEVHEHGDPALILAVQNGEISIGTARALIRKTIDRIKRANREGAETRLAIEKFMELPQSDPRKLSELDLAHMNELRAKYQVTPKYGVRREKRG